MKNFARISFTRFMMMKNLAHISFTRFLRKNSISTKAVDIYCFNFNSSQFVISSMEIEKVSKRFSNSPIEMSHPIFDYVSYFHILTELKAYFSKSPLEFPELALLLKPHQKTLMTDDIILDILLKNNLLGRLDRKHK